MIKNLVWKATFLALLAGLVVPTGSFAVQTGGGYIVNDRITPAKGISTGGGFSLTSSAAPISNITTGGGFSSFGGGYYTVTTPVVTPTPSSGGGGGGGSSGQGYCLPGQVGVYPNCVASKGSVGRKVDNHTFAQIRAETPAGKSPYRADPYPDNYIDIRDFNLLMVNLNKRQGVNTLYCGDKANSDINCDGIADVKDFNILMVFWGKPVWPQDKMSWYGTL